MVCGGIATDRPRLDYGAVIMLRSGIAKSKVSAICVHWGARSLVAVDVRFLLGCARRSQEDHPLKTQTIKQRLLHSTMIGGTALMALVAAPALTLMTPSVAIAQNLTQGAVAGTVENQAGTPVAGAEVTLTSVAQGFSRSFTTDADGSFRAVALPQGRYEVVVNASGYNSLTDTVSVGSGGTASLILTLGAAADNATQIDEVVVVGVRRAVSEFDATTTGLTVNVEELSRNVPIARDAGAVALLAPGVTMSDGAFGNIPTIGGASAGENTYFINGLNITKFRDFTGSSTVPFEFYQTIETKTGG